MTLTRRAVLCLVLGTSLRLAAQDSMQDLRLNQIQIKGTHNSYHQKPTIVWHPSHAYSHLSLSDQLEKRGIRAFELDVHRPTFGSDLLVYHIMAVDAKTSCSKFRDCLQELRNWSDQHRDHVPIIIWIEIKDATGGPKFADFNRVDEEIREVLGDRLITPDVLQKDYETLQDAVQTEGWPRLAEARGKFLFILDDDERAHDVYVRSDSLKGRAMFLRASPATIDKPWAVTTKTGPGTFHSDALQRNFLISDNLCSAENEVSECHSKLTKAIEAGTHILMDDFEGGDARQSHGDYFVNLTDAFVVACNPISAPFACNSDEIKQR